MSCLIRRKNAISRIFVIILLFFLIVADGNAAVQTSDGMSSSSDVGHSFSLLSDNFLKLIGCSLSDSVVYIPADVTELPDFAFADNTQIIKVIFPKDSKCHTIGEYAFYRCGNLRDIVFPESLKLIGSNSFRECDGLSDITLPPNVEDIRGFSFAYCKNLKTINFPPSLTHIGTNAFARCESLEEVVLPDSVTELESYIFVDCNALVYARLPGNPSLLGELIFNCCDKLSVVCEPSSTPPQFDCNSFIFDTLDMAAYKRCTLVVPAGSVELYRNAGGWKQFLNIQDIYTYDP